MVIEIMQLNAGKRHLAWDALNVYLQGLKRRIKVMLIQEPQTIKDKVRNLVKGNTYADGKGKAPRTAIYVDYATDKKCNAFLISELTDRDHVAIQLDLQLPGGAIIKSVICSIYLPGDSKDITEDLRFITKIRKYCNVNNRELIIGGDFNSHNEIWGSATTTPRGDETLDIIIKEGLHLLNKGSMPTYDQGNGRQSVIDLTLATKRISEKIFDWSVIQEDSFSDHKKITFSLEAEEIQETPYRRKKSTNWKKYKDDLKPKLPLINNDEINNKEKLEETSTKLKKSIIEAYEENCKLKHRKNSKIKSWFSAELDKERYILRKYYSSIRNQNEWSTYREMRNRYKANLSKARFRSYKNMTQEIDNLPEAMKLQKLFEHGKTKKISSLRNSNGEYTTSMDDTMQTLLLHFFPNCASLNVNDSWMEDRYEIPSVNAVEWMEILECTSSERIEWAINDFLDFKSPGEDGIFPALLKKADKEIVPILQKLFRASLKLGYIPTSWREALVVFIPKPGKEDYGVCSSYRPICLMSFILKTLEKLVEKQAREQIAKHNPLNKNQHAYQTGKGTESALHQLISRIDSTIQNKRIYLTVFIDISGAFDNTGIGTIVTQAKNKGVSPWIVSWIKMMLSNRRIKAQCSLCTCKIRPEGGCPQGGCLSPLLWCLVVDSLIVKLSEHGMDVVAYADDLAIGIMGNDGTTLSNKMNEAMKIVQSWCVDTGLSVNPSKSQVMRFTLKQERNLDTKLKPIILYGEEIKLFKEVRYLGVYLDSKLSMSKHFEYISGKATKMLFATRNMVSRNWGLRPHMMKWIYTASAIPKMTYASITFWHKVDIQSNADKLRKVQRMAEIMITGATRGTPSLTLDALTGLTPIDIKIKECAILCYKRLLQAGTWNVNAPTNLHAGVAKLANKIDQMETDEQNSKNFVKIEYNVTFAISGSTLVESDRPRLEAWTDASHDINSTGIGIYIPSLNVEDSLKINSNCNITQAETAGIAYCVETLLEKDIRNHNITIFTDSKAAATNLNKCVMNSKTTIRCNNVLNRLCNSGNCVTIQWIKSHSGNTGNDRADDLARKARGKAAIDKILPATEQNWRDKVTKWSTQKSQELWNKQTHMKHSKFMMNGFLDKRFQYLIKKSRNEIRIITGMMSGICPLRKHLHIIGRFSNKNCRFCGLPEETPVHLIMDCTSSTVTEARERTLGRQQISSDNIKQIDINKLLPFIRKIDLYEALIKYKHN